MEMQCVSEAETDILDLVYMKFRLQRDNALNLRVINAIQVVLMFRFTSQHAPLINYYYYYKVPWGHAVA
jgi:hypothetical protein